MKRRWIIRSFFIGLLLLCVGGWVWSYKYGWIFRYSRHNGGSVRSHWGKIHLTWMDDSWAPFPTERWHIYPADAAIDANYIKYIHNGHYSHHCLGFFITIEADSMFVVIPFWFPTTISAALLWLVWRWTRPRVQGRAFPVEIAKADKGRAKAE